jgi:hypothetical protein
MITGAMPAPQTTPPTYHNPAPDHPQHDFAGALVTTPPDFDVALADAVD